MQETNQRYSVIIDSIGSASPVIAKFLADSFNIKHEITLKLLYCTPSIFFHKIDEESALKSGELLRKLGLEIVITESDCDLPAPPELYDVCLYIQDAEKLPLVTKQLAEFLGCSEQEAFNLLLNEPSVVLGNVSKNTAGALSHRVDAEVIISKPNEDLYTLEVLTEDSNFLRQLKTVLNSFGIVFNPGKEKIIDNIDYEKGREIWRRMNNTKTLNLSSQSFKRYEIILESVDESNPGYTEVLIKEIGMPEEIISDLLKNLPVVLNESVNRHDLEKLLSIYQKAGLKCIFNAIPHGERQIIIEDLSDKAKAEEVISQFYPGTVINENSKPWVLPKSVKPLIARYLGARLEQIGCVVEQKFINV